MKVAQLTMLNDGRSKLTACQLKKGILMGLRLGKVLGVKCLLIQSDSKLVIEQIKGEYEAKEERMQKYLD